MTVASQGEDEDASGLGVVGGSGARAGGSSCYWFGSASRTTARSWPRIGRQHQGEAGGCGRTPRGEGRRAQAQACARRSGGAEGAGARGSAQEAGVVAPWGKEQGSGGSGSYTCHGLGF